MDPEIIKGIFAISGAVIVAVIAGLFAWALQNRNKTKRELKILASKPKDLVDIDDSLRGMIDIQIVGMSVDTVSSVDYYIVNSGNDVLHDLEVYFTFSNGTRILGGNCPELNFSTTEKEAFVLSIVENSSCSILAGFLNPGDEARGHIFLNKADCNLEVSFRQPGVSVSIDKNYDPARLSAVSEMLYDAAKSNWLLDSYFRLAIPAYKKHRAK